LTTPRLRWSMRRTSVAFFPELMMACRRCVALLVLVGSLFADLQLSRTASAQSGRPPNVVVILADDQGWGDLSIHGNTNLSTPHIDSLGKDGALFDRFFVCQVCSPTRAEFLTGRYHGRLGVTGTSEGFERVDPSVKTIANSFQSAGYATGIFGKWHNGTQTPYHPNDRGFDEFYGFTSGHWGLYFDPPLEHNRTLVRGKGYIADDLTTHAISFIEQHKDQPFLCYVPFNTPHSPPQVPDRFFEKFLAFEPKLRNREPNLEKIEMTRAVLAMCENIDWNVGRILAALDQQGLANETIVLYFSDNGPNSPRWNGDMKGRKGSIDEGGIRSPLLVRWPGKIKPGTRIEPIAAAIDLLPTLTDLAGIPRVGTKPLDGTSLAPLLLGQPVEWPDRMLFAFKGAGGSQLRGKVDGSTSVRTQRFRLDASGQLFDMLADPGQRTDVAARHPDVVKSLTRHAREFRSEMLAALEEFKDRPFTVGYSATTMLPARDGLPHGGIARSGLAPNDSYFMNWTSLNDSITWDVQVGQPGDYEAIIHYTCPAADVGSTIELATTQGSAVRTKITEAYDPPLLDKGLDRTGRSNESYVKDFKPLSLGTIRLEAGRSLLTLRAKEMPGTQVADVKYLMLNQVQPSAASK
jgi:arylsulfatase A-like enzyme